MHLEGIHSASFFPPFILQPFSNRFNFFSTPPQSVPSLFSQPIQGPRWGLLLTAKDWRFLINEGTDEVPGHQPYWQLDIWDNQADGLPKRQNGRSTREEKFNMHLCWKSVKAGVESPRWACWSRLQWLDGAISTPGLGVVEIHGQQGWWAAKSVLEATKKASWWLWIKRGDLWQI